MEVKIRTESAPYQKILGAIACTVERISGFVDNSEIQFGALRVPTSFSYVRKLGAASILSHTL